MRIGLVGTGRIGIAHAEVVREHPAVSELLVADLDPARARAVADKLQVTAADLDAVFSEVDGVIIAAPTGAHAGLVSKGLAAGVNVFCEKPLALGADVTRALTARIAAAGALVRVGFQRRFDPGYRAARDALRAGDLGTLQRMHLITADAAPPSHDYIAASGGIFRDCHIHDFDLAGWITGQDVVEVTATGTDHGTELFAGTGDVDSSVAILTLADGTLATVQGSRYNGAGYDVRMELAGTRGTWAVGLDDRAPLTSAEPGITFPSGKPWISFLDRFAAAYTAEIGAFLGLIAGDAPGDAADLATPEEALAALHIADAAELSRSRHRPVAIEEVR